MAEKRGQYVYNDDGTVSTLVSIAGAEDSGSGGALGVNVKQSEAIVPVDIQARLSQTIQTHTGAVVTPSGNSYGNYSSSFIDCDGFDEIAITLSNDAVTGNQVGIYWSNDNTNLQGYEDVITNAVLRYRAGSTKIKARYARVLVYNTDSAAPHTMNAYAYLKV